MGYVTEQDLTAYGVTDPNAYELIDKASRIIDQYVRQPLNADGFKFPRFQSSYWERDGDYVGNASLSGAVLADDTTLTLTGTLTGYGTGYFLIGGYRGESVKVTAFDPNTGIATIERGANDTYAQSWSSGAPVAYGKLPIQVKNATCEQIIWLLQQGDEYAVQGGDSAQVETPLLAPLARLYLRGLAHRVGYMGPL